MALPNQFAPCFLSDLARMVDVPTATFTAWLTPDDWAELKKSGYQGQRCKLPPPAVKYLRQKFVDL